MHITEIRTRDSKKPEVQNVNPSKNLSAKITFHFDTYKTEGSPAIIDCELEVMLLMTTLDLAPCETCLRRGRELAPFFKEYPSYRFQQLERALLKTILQSQSLDEDDTKQLDWKPQKLSNTKSAICWFSRLFPVDFWPHGSPLLHSTRKLVAGLFVEMTLCRIGPRFLWFSRFKDTVG